MLLGPGAFAAVTVLGTAVLAGCLHRRVRLWPALNAGALMAVVFVHWLIGQSLYELNQLCPSCAVACSVASRPSSGRWARLLTTPTTPSIRYVS